VRLAGGGLRWSEVVRECVGIDGRKGWYRRR